MASKTGKIVLYGMYKSSATWRVRIALALKGLEYEKVSVDLHKGEQQSADYRLMNPMGQIPTLSVDGVLLNQSLPILEYLEETWPSPPILPQDKAARAKVRGLAEVVNSGIQPLQNITVVDRLKHSHPDWGHTYCCKGLEALDKMMQHTAGQYSYGDAVSLADICLVPQVFNSITRFNINTSAYPTVQRVYESLVTLPEFRSADPRRQPDTPAELRID